MIKISAQRGSGDGLAVIHVPCPSIIILASFLLGCIQLFNKQSCSIRTSHNFFCHCCISDRITSSVSGFCINKITIMQMRVLQAQTQRVRKKNIESQSVLLAVISDLLFVLLFAFDFLKGSLEDFGVSCREKIGEALSLKIIISLRSSSSLQLLCVLDADCLDEEEEDKIPPALLLASSL